MIRHAFAAALGAALLALAGCATPPGPASGATIPPGTRIALLGEVHDNADGHRARLRVLEAAIAAGWRPAIAMEQFDREFQPQLEAAQRTCRDAACVIAAAAPGKARWDWPLYEPVIALALREQLPLFAANLSRTDAARVMREGLGAVFTPAELAALDLQRDAPEALRSAQEKEVDAAHCGQLPAALVPGMATAQIARDAMMARVLSLAAAGDTAAGGGSPRPAVLLAGNGHVRRDMGVPHWLGGEARAWSIGFVEQAAPAGRYDRQVVVPPTARPDPCAALRARPLR